MSKDELHKIAEGDTPEKVSVPNTWPGLITWAIVRVGPALVLAVAFIAAIGYAVNKVYADLAATNRVVLEIVREQAAANQRQAISNDATTVAIRDLTKQVEANTRAMDAAHQRAAFK